MQKILSVTQLNQYIQKKLDDDILLTNVAVSGEISNYKLHSSGHHYFTLKDESGALKCVMFRGNAYRLRFRPENGLKVIAVGSISVYPRDGIYQLYCTALTVDGEGDLHTAFEQLKRRLAAQGLFAPEHKKPLPEYPGIIGIVTSPTGAALHDMLRILRMRYPLTQVRLLPARVQGAEAAGEIAAAIQYANHHKLCDLLIVGRGGGSIEDLWPFNEEIVAQAIYQSQMPVISAVGHEPDVTISDYVADLRAATPSNAAELSVPDQNALRQVLDSTSVSMATILNRQLQNAARQLELLSGSPSLKSPHAYIEQRATVLEHLNQRLVAAHTQIIDRKTHRFTAVTGKLDALSPLKVLSRGYAMTQDDAGNVIRSVQQVKCDDKIRIRLNDGAIVAKVEDIEEKML